MKIKVEQCYSNGWRGKTNNTESLNLDELRNLSIKNYNEIKNTLIKDEKINVSECFIYDVIWDERTQTESDPNFEQVRTSFYIEKNGRTKTSENDIYKIVNKIHVSYFSKK